MNERMINPTWRS